MLSSLPAFQKGDVGCSKTDPQSFTLISIENSHNGRKNFYSVHHRIRGLNCKQCPRLGPESTKIGAQGLQQYRLRVHSLALSSGLFDLKIHTHDLRPPRNDPFRITHLFTSFQARIYSALCLHFRFGNTSESFQTEASDNPESPFLYTQSVVGVEFRP